jgi:hypothetical protein
MRRYTIQRKTNYAPKYDVIEVLMIATGAALIVVIAFVL